MESLAGERNLAVESAIRNEGNRLLRFIRRRVRTDEDAEDILQDVFFQLAASYSITEPIEQLTSWLFRVARNRIIDWYRKRRAAPAPGEAGHDRPGPDPDEVLFDSADIPDEVYSRSMIWSALMDALDELPENQRNVFVMHELEGKTFKEIAELTGEPLNTLLSRKRYAVLFLREQLQELYDDMEHP